jgi:hypothetical protein
MLNAILYPLNVNFLKIFQSLSLFSYLSYYSVLFVIKRIRRTKKPLKEVSMIVCTRECE